MFGNYANGLLCEQKTKIPYLMWINLIIVGPIMDRKAKIRLLYELFLVSKIAGKIGSK